MPNEEKVAALQQKVNALDLEFVRLRDIITGQKPDIDPNHPDYKTKLAAFEFKKMQKRINGTRKKGDSKPWCPRNPSKWQRELDALKTRYQSLLRELVDVDQEDIEALDFKFKELQTTMKEDGIISLLQKRLDSMRIEPKQHVPFFPKFEDRTSFELHICKNILEESDTDTDSDNNTDKDNKRGQGIVDLKLDAVGADQFFVTLEKIDKLLFEDFKFVAPDYYKESGPGFVRNYVTIYFYFNWENEPAAEQLEEKLQQALQDLLKSIMPQPESELEPDPKLAVIVPRRKFSLKAV